MYIVRINANADGSRPPIQTWDKKTPPDNYAICPDDFIDIFYSTDPAGFVNITVENNTVIEMTVNEEAYNAYIASLPEPEPEPEPEPIPDEWDEMLNAYTEGVNSI